MNIKHTFIGIAAVSLMLISAPAHAEPVFDSETQAKLARFKARKKLDNKSFPQFNRPEFGRPGFGRFGQPEGQTPCGAIDLGNVENATLMRGADGITVIIDGDVINADNHCR